MVWCCAFVDMLLCAIKTSILLRQFLNCLFKRIHTSDIWKNAIIKPYCRAVTFFGLMNVSNLQSKVPLCSKTKHSPLIWKFLASVI